MEQLYLWKWYNFRPLVVQYIPTKKSTSGKEVNGSIIDSVHSETTQRAYSAASITSSLTERRNASVILFQSW